MDAKRFNPLVLDPEDYDKLFDDEFTEKDEEKSDGEYESLCGGGRRRKPITLDY